MDINLITTTKEDLWKRIVEKKAIEGIEKIEDEFNNTPLFLETTEGGREYVSVVVSEEYGNTVRKLIAEHYITVSGWEEVLHSTSSENGERGGLTSFEFFFN